MKKEACIYQKREKFIIHSYSYSITGLSIASSPFIILPINCSPDEIASNVIKALNSFKTGVPHPTDWKKQQKDFLSNVQEKSIKSLQTDSKLCNIELEGFTLTVYPTENLGWKEGFVPLEDLKITSSLENVSQTIYDALKLCK